MDFLPIYVDVLFVYSVFIVDVFHFKWRPIFNEGYKNLKTKYIDAKICEKKVFWDSVHVLVIFNTEIVEYLVRNFASRWRKIKVFHDFN